MDSYLDRAVVEFDTNRVAGNALIGLSIAGEDGVADKIIRLSAHSAAEFRSTAAWMMGIGSPGFLDALQRLTRDDCVMVKGAALRAMPDVPTLAPVYYRCSANKIRVHCVVTHGS